MAENIPKKCLHRADCNGTDEDVKIMKVMLEEDPDSQVRMFIYDDGMAPISPHDKTYFDPLLFAIAANHVKCVNFLLEAGFNPNIQAARNNMRRPTISTLTLALSNGAPIEIIETLLKHGADPNKPHGRPVIVSTCDGQHKALELFLKYGASLEDYYNPKNNTTTNHSIAEIAASNGRLQCLKTLILYGSETDLLKVYLKQHKLFKQGRLGVHEPTLNQLLPHAVFLNACNDEFNDFDTGPKDREGCLRLLSDTGVDLDAKGPFKAPLEYHQVVREHPSMVKVIQDSKYKPKSLIKIARCNILNLMRGRNYLQNIKALELPSSLVDFLCFNDFGVPLL